MSITTSQRVSISPDVLFRVVGDEAVLLNLKTELYLGLDPVGTRMWNVLKESSSIQAAYETLLQEYDVTADAQRNDLNEFLGKLVDQKLIEIQPSQL